MPTANSQVTITGIGASLTATKALTAGFAKDLDENIGIGATDLELFFELDVSETKLLVLLSDQDLTIETNDGTTPTDTVTLTAGVPVVFDGGSNQTNPFGSGDVTSIFATNASGAIARLRIKALVDPTP